LLSISLFWINGAPLDSMPLQWLCVMMMLLIVGDAAPM
jgi:hypothetical protein